MENKYDDELQGIISKMLKPLKHISFGAVIEGLSGHNVIPFNSNDRKDIELLRFISKIAEDAAEEVNVDGILRPRPNEVGNDIEPFVINAIRRYDFDASIPKTQSGRKKATGYPDIIFTDKFERKIYIECKTYNIKNIATTQRSFYLSPSDDFKVKYDAIHIGMCFEIIVAGNKGNNHLYKCRSWKILDLSQLEVDVKYEFNSDNKRLYSKKIILAEGKV